MVFSSSIFLYIFLPLVLILYYLMPWMTGKNMILLLFSLVFYAWGEPIYIVLMVVSILINYIFGRLVHSCHRNNQNGKWPLFLAVILNLGLLFYFKYFGFAVSTVSGLLGMNWSVPQIALPIGISFYTFQGMSYVIDVYRDKGADDETVLVQKDILKLALYISMFPQLIAGPIVRYIDIFPRLSRRKHTLDQFVSGVELFIIGLSKKVIFANILGSAADAITANGLSQMSAPQAWFSALFYMLQIFYDFCGYSEMAIGLGRMFGFEFMKNFNYPYISRSITEFWRRWHISLSTWFRDYLYIPLGGNRRGNVYVNLFIVFLATGIWHGADGSFVIWGLWHGAFMLLERMLKKRDIRLPLPVPVKAAAGWIYTMLVVFFGWVVFRLASIPDSIQYFKVMFGIVKPEFVPFGLRWFLNDRTLFVFIMAVLCCIPWKEMLQKYIPRITNMWTHPGFVAGKRMLLILLLTVCFMLITNSTYNPFIYFRF